MRSVLHHHGHIEKRTEQRAEFLLCHDHCQSTVTVKNGGPIVGRISSHGASRSVADAPRIQRGSKVSSATLTDCYAVMMRVGDHLLRVRQLTS